MRLAAGVALGGRAVGEALEPGVVPCEAAGVGLELPVFDWPLAVVPRPQPQRAAAATTAKVARQPTAIGREPCCHSRAACPPPTCLPHIDIDDALRVYRVDDAVTVIAPQSW